MLSAVNLDTEGVTKSIFIVLTCGIPVVAIIAFAWARVRRIESEARLKRSMVERGMSVEEMERVLRMKA